MSISTTKTVRFSDNVVSFASTALPTTNNKTGGASSEGIFWYLRKEIKLIKKQWPNYHEEKMKKLEHRCNHMHLVLGQQEEHRKELNGESDHQGLRMFSATLSKPDTKIAIQQARLDALEAHEIHFSNQTQNAFTRRNSLRVRSVEDFSKRTSMILGSTSPKSTSSSIMTRSSSSRRSLSGGSSRMGSSRSLMTAVSSATTTSSFRRSATASSIPRSAYSSPSLTTTTVSSTNSSSRRKRPSLMQNNILSKAA